MLAKSGIFFGVTLVDVQVIPAGDNVGASHSIGAVSYGGSGSTIVDSGTTYSYLPASLRANFEARWLAVTGFAYSTTKPLTQAQASMALPDLAFVLDGAGAGSGPAVLRVGPAAYLDHWCRDVGGGAVACDDYQTVQWEGATLLLGANVLEDHDVLFDAEGGRLGVAPATDCAFANGPTPAPTVTPAPTTSPLPTAAPSLGPPPGLGLDTLAVGVAAGLLAAACLGVVVMRRLISAVGAFRAARQAQRAADRAARRSGVAVPRGGGSGGDVPGYGPLLGRLCACALVVADRPCWPGTASQSTSSGSGSGGGGGRLGRSSRARGRFSVLGNDDDDLDDATEASTNAAAIELESAVEMAPVGLQRASSGDAGGDAGAVGAEQVITFADEPDDRVRRPARAVVQLPSFNPMAMLGRSPGGYVRPGEGSEF